MTDKVLVAYQNLSSAVAYIVVGQERVEYLLQPLCEFGTLYGINVDSYRNELVKRNDVQAVADSMRGDPLVQVRIIGTLAQNLADIAGCVYDVEASLQMSEVIGQMLGTILIIQELDNA